VVGTPEANPRLSAKSGEKRFCQVKHKRFSREQIQAIVKQAEIGLPVAELTRTVEISEQAF
jgi:hypothetical protein